MITAERIAMALGGHKAGNGWSARCPAHDDHRPSLSLRTGDNGNVLVHCFAGCSQTQVIEALRYHGLWDKCGRQFTSPKLSVSKNSKPHRGDGKREAAHAIWQATKPASGTLVESYLASRKLVLPSTTAVRFHPNLKHSTGRHWPAMVALVTDGATGEAIGIHRTFLALDGSGKAPIEPQKMMLGPCLGGAVRLAEPGDVLMVGEGLETCLAAMHATGKPAWAALSTSGMHALELPRAIHNVVVLADGDDAGEAAACDCAWRWQCEGRHVRIARPPRGQDFNDMLLGHTARVEVTAP